MAQLHSSSLRQQIAVPAGLVVSLILVWQQPLQWELYVLLAIFVFGNAIRLKTPAASAKNVLRTILLVMLTGFIIGTFSIGWREGLAYSATFFTLWIVRSAIVERRANAAGTGRT